MNKPIGEQAWDRYDIDLHNSPSPWLLSETFQTFFLLEVLPSQFPAKSWLRGPLLHDYRWRVSYWHDKQHRLSSDLFIPLTSRASSSSSSSAATMVTSVSSRDDGIAVATVFAFNVDWLDRSQQRDMNYSDKCSQAALGIDDKFYGMNGMYMIVELVHSVSGIPISRGSIRVSPQFAKLESDEHMSIGAVNSITLDLSACYDLHLSTAALPNRNIIGGTTLPLHELPEFSCVMSYIRAPSHASHWKINRQMVILPGFIPSPREVLCSAVPSARVDQLSRPCRCFLQVEELQIAPDLLELCTSDRVMISAHSMGGPAEAEGLNPYASLTPAFLGEMLTNEEGSWLTCGEVLLPPNVTSVSKLKLDVVGVTIRADSSFGSLIGNSAGSCIQTTMELCCGVLSPKCKRVQSSSSTMYDPNHRGHEEGKGLEELSDHPDLLLEPGIYEIPLFAHPTLIVCGYREIDEDEPEGIFVGRIVVKLNILGDGGESLNDATDLDPYLFPKIYNFNVAGTGLYAHSDPTSVAASICDHIIVSLLSPDPLPIWMLHADVGDDMGRKHVYDKLGLVDTISALAACSRRVASQSSGLSRSMLSPGTIHVSSGQKEDTKAALTVASRLVHRLLQSGMCDASALSTLAFMLEEAGGTPVLWSVFQSWISSASVQHLTKIAQGASSKLNGAENTKSSGPSSEQDVPLFILSRDEFDQARVACWCYRILGFNHYIERIHGLPIIMAREGGEAGTITTASLAEDVLHILLGFVAPTIRRLVNDYSVCITHATVHSNAADEALVNLELEKQRCICVTTVVDVLNSSLENASLLLPVAGDMTLEVANSLAAIVESLILVPFTPLLEVYDTKHAALGVASECIARLLTFMSLLIRQQPSGLNLLQRPAPYVWTKSSLGMNNKNSLRLQHSNFNSSIPHKRFESQSSTADYITESIAQVSYYLSNRGAETFRKVGGLISGSITIALRDLACSIERAIASRIMNQESLGAKQDSSPMSPIPNLPTSSRRKRGGVIAGANAATTSKEETLDSSGAISTKSDINAIYAQHKAFIAKDTSGVMPSLGKITPLGMRSPERAISANRTRKGDAIKEEGKDEPVTVTAVRSLMENGSLAVELRSGSFALRGDEAVVYLGERIQFLNSLLMLAAAIGAMSEIPCDRRVGNGGAMSATKSRAMIEFMLNSIIRGSSTSSQHSSDDLMSKALQNLAHSLGPSGSYFVLLLIHVVDTIDLYWISTTAFAKSVGKARSYTFAAPHVIIPRLMSLEKAYLPLQLARDVGLLTEAAKAFFARVFSDEALSVGEVRSFSNAQKLRAATMQGKFKGIDEQFLLSGGDVCAISTWLRLRRHLMDSVVGVLRSGIRLGLFEADALLAQTAAEAKDKLNSTMGFNPKQSHPASRDAFMRRLQALSSLADISSNSPTREVSTVSFSGTPLNCLVWLLRDLADMEPLQQGRCDLALLCLQSNDDAKRTLTTLFSIAVDLPVVSASSILPGSSSIAMVLDLAREDLLGGCINVMQIMSFDINTSPLTLEPYFQSMIDECIAHCIPPTMKAMFDPALSALLKSCDSVEPNLVNGSLPGFAAAVSSLLRLLNEPFATTSKALGKMRERLIRRLTAIRTFVVAKTTASSDTHKGADPTQIALKKSFSLITAGAALQTLLHMAPQQKGKGGWGLDLRDRNTVLHELNRLTPSNGIINWDKLKQNMHSILNNQHHTTFAQIVSIATSNEEDMFDPLRNLGSGHRAGQAILELSIREALMLTEPTKVLEEGSPFFNLEYGEEEHRCGRSALAYMLQCGEWETGVAVALSLAEQCRRTHKKIDEALAHATQRVGIMTTNSSGQLIHELTLRSKRQAALQNELSKAHEKLQQRLVHDGPLRPLPIFFALRFLENPWIDSDVDTGLKSFLEATNCHLQGYTFTASETDSDENADEYDYGVHEKKKEEETPDGIGRGMWILLRYDPTAFSRTAEIYADLAEKATKKLRRRNNSESSSSSSDSDSASESSDTSSENNDGDDRVHVPLPSACSMAIQAQLLRAFPSYQMLPPSTLVELDLMSDQTHPRAMQLFQAFPAALCVAADAGLGSSETVGVHAVMTSKDNEKDANALNDEDYEYSATFKANDALKRGDVQPESDWEIAMHSDTFYIFASLDHDNDMSDHFSTDAGIVRLTLSTVSAISGAEAAKGHKFDSDDDNDDAGPEQSLLSWAGDRSLSIGRMHSLAPASLLFISDAKRFTAFDAGMSVIRHQLQALNRVQFALSKASKLTAAEIMQQNTLDITSNASIMAAAASTVANMIMSPATVCVGVHNARTLVSFSLRSIVFARFLILFLIQVAGESDRLETLWQRQRKQAKREYMRLVTQYEAELKDAIDYGLDSHRHPEPPEDPDFSELEDQHQLARLNLERLSARRISCVSLIENLLQYLRLCSLVFPSQALDTGKTFVGDVFGSPSARTRNMTTDDIHAHLEALIDIDDDDEMKILWLQITLWLESAVAGLEFSIV